MAWHAKVLEQFIIEHELDERAAGALYEEDDAVQKLTAILKAGYAFLVFVFICFSQLLRLP